MKSITLLTLLITSVICRYQEQASYDLGDQQQCDIKFANSIVRSKLPSQHIVTSLEDMGCYKEAKAFKKESGLDATEGLEDQQQCDVKFANVIVKSKLPIQHIVNSLEDMGCYNEAKTFQQTNGLEDNEYGDKSGEWDNLDPNFFDPSYYSGRKNKNDNAINISYYANNEAKGVNKYSNKNKNKNKNMNMNRYKSYGYSNYDDYYY